MDSRVFKFALPATLVVSTFVSASACRDEHVYCGDIERKKKCESESICQWSEDNDACISACYDIDNQADCDAIGCFWESEEGSGETGGVIGNCNEPFT
jgi:hypothetical protein